jgi:hypothetical protein
MRFGHHDPENKAIIAMHPALMPRLFCILFLTIAACDCDDGNTPMDGGPGLDLATDDAAIDGGPVEDGATSPDAAVDGGAPERLQVERWGARMWGAAIAITPIGDATWIGTRAVLDEVTGEVHGQLIRVDRTTGAVDVWDDELPAAALPGGSGPTSTGRVIEQSERTLVLAPGGLVVLDASGSRVVTLPAGGENASPTEMIDGGDTLWVATDAGLLDVDPASLAVRDTLDPETLGGQPTSLAFDAATGDVYATLLGEGGSGSVVRVSDGAVAARLSADEVVPEGAPKDVVFSASRGIAYVAIASWNALSGGVVGWDGDDGADWIASEGELTEALTRDPGAFGASVLALADDEDLLLVGGQLQSTLAGLRGGGLAIIDLAQLPTLAVGGTTSARSGLGGDHIGDLAYDERTHRIWVASSFACNESRLGFAGVDSFTYVDGEPRFTKPILGGVRALQTVDGEVWVGLRDEIPGARCFGMNSQQGLVAIRSNHGGEAVELPTITDFGFWHPNRIGPSEILPGDGDTLVLQVRRDSLYVTDGDRAFLQNPTFLGPSLWLHDVAFQDGDTFWLGGRATHSVGDGPELADVGPRGAARVDLSSGTIGDVTHYVRATRDPAGPDTITGLPSSDVRAIVPDGDIVWLISGIERTYAGSDDRNDGTPFTIGGEQRRGGLTRVEADGSITVVANAVDVPDGRAAALDPEGVLHVLDARNGLLRWTGSEVEAVELPVTVPSGAIPQTLVFGSEGTMVLGYDRGAVVQIGEVAEWLDGFGYVWTAMERGPGVVLLGTDEGLVRVRAPGVDPIAEPAPASGARPPVLVIREGGMGGGDPDMGVPDMGGPSCKGEAEVCSPGECCAGLVCGGSGIVTACVPE